jgi:hypothetical protein
MVFENGVKNIQAAAYNGAHTVLKNFGFKVSICFFLHRPGYSVVAQGRKLVHDKNCLLRQT